MLIHRGHEHLAPSNSWRGKSAPKFNTPCAAQVCRHGRLSAAASLGIVAISGPFIRRSSPCFRRGKPVPAQAGIPRPSYLSVCGTTFQAV
ncbi:MAG: hypothetical protein AAB403_01465, partial [Planctomycetota bacterium]